MGKLNKLCILVITSLLLLLSITSSLDHLFTEAARVPQFHAIQVGRRLELEVVAAGRGCDGYVSDGGDLRLWWCGMVSGCVGAGMMAIMGKKEFNGGGQWGTRAVRRTLSKWVDDNPSRPPPPTGNDHNHNNQRV
ncbi:hypothetical protein ACFE04_029580 [Oxalis oulophora]